MENSLSVHHRRHQCGIGSLPQELIARARARRLGHHALISGIDPEQTVSVALPARFQFEKVGHFRQFGFKFGRWLDVVYEELILTAN